MLVMLIKPFSLIKVSCMVGVRGTAIAINAWVEIVCAFIYFNLRAQLYELRDRLDSLMWDRKELNEHIRVAIKEHEMMEIMMRT
ncbi:hypothetical protein Hanom_Chr01g00066481 [Helianthus anomalus]